MEHCAAWQWHIGGAEVSTMALFPQSRGNLSTDLVLLYCFIFNVFSVQFRINGGMERPITVVTVSNIE